MYKLTALSTAVLLYLYAQHKRKTDLILHGQIRLSVAVLTACVDRLFLFPLRRLFRWLSIVTNLGLPQPSYLSDFTDIKGRAFLTHILRQQSYLARHQFVAAVRVVQFSSGQMSNSARLELQYSDITCDSTTPTSTGLVQAPPSFIVKMARQDIKGKALNMLVGLYRECDCYSTLLPSTGCPVPDILFSSVDAFSKDYLLILSDGSYLGPEIGYVDSTTVGALSLAPGIKVDALSAPGILPCVYDQVAALDSYGKHTNVPNIPHVVHMMKRSCVELSKMHVKYWNCVELFEMDLSLGNVDSLAEAYAAVILAWSATKQKARSGLYEGTLPWRGAKDLDAFETLVERSLMAHVRRWGQETHNDPTSWRIIDAESYRTDIVADAGFTLLHGDFHSENVFVRTIPEGCTLPDFLILDWQLPSVGDPVKDVARMIVCGGLDHLGRENYEMEILKAWWEAFTTHTTVSAQEYPWELAILSYKYWAAHHAALLIMTAEISKFFEEDNAAGYRMSVDKFVAICKLHGDPVDNFEKRAQFLSRMAVELNSSNR